MIWNSYKCIWKDIFQISSNKFNKYGFRSAEAAGKDGHRGGMGKDATRAGHRTLDAAGSGGGGDTKRTMPKMVQSSWKKGNHTRRVPLRGI